jgi:2-keto-4-pentenoate hydratase
MREQLERRREALDRGASHVGWKIGLNIPEVQQQLGIEEPVLGHLTSETVLADGHEFDASASEKLMAEPEVAIELGEGRAIASLAPAIELVDVGRPPGGFQAIIAANIFHRAFVLGPEQPAFPAEGVKAEVSVNGEVRAQAAAPDEFSDVVELTARLLEAAGEHLHEGDTIIGGSLTEQVDVGPGDLVAADLGRLGHVEVRVT